MDLLNPSKALSRVRPCIKPRLDVRSISGHTSNRVLYPGCSKGDFPALGS